ncbi:MAG: flavin reductase family protein [Lautropia sp.]
MHYETAKRNHGLRHDPFKALVVPRPIGWISTVSRDGVLNLAPYSFFNAIADNPQMVMFSSAGTKDSLRNILDTRQFTCSMATWALREHMNVSSAPVAPDADEFALAGLTPAPSTLVKAPRVAESPAAIECELWQTIELPQDAKRPQLSYTLVLARVLAIYVDDAFIRDGLVDTAAMRPLARMGYMDYAFVTPETAFVMNRPLVAEDGSVTSPPGVWDGVYR